MKFSIIMPTYNCEKYVGEAVKSILGQTYGDYELIIVDDGSQDGTLLICEQLAKGKGNVHICAAEHGGVSFARNLGLSKASGNYVLFIDSDDSWENELLERVSKVLRPEDELLIFGYSSDYYLSDGTYQYSESSFGDEGKIVSIPKDYSIDTVFASYNMAAPWNKVFRNDVLKKNNLFFNERCVYLEDLKFNLDFLSCVTNIKVLKKDLYHYRLITDRKQLLKRNFEGLFVNADEVFASCENFLIEHNTSLESTEILSGIMIKLYVNELLYHINQKNKQQRKEIFSNLLKNERFKILLRTAKGKFFKVFNALSILKLSSIQIKMLKNRYGC